MNIPDEAVEAAAWIVITGKKYDFVPVKIARAAVEAAAPHIQAKAWEAGKQAALAEMVGRGPAVNPYTRDDAPKVRVDVLVPDDAVEAAVDKLVRMREEGEHSSYEYARAVVEAATPHILRERDKSWWRKWR